MGFFLGVVVSLLGSVVVRFLDCGVVGMWGSIMLVIGSWVFAGFALLFCLGVCWVCFAILFGCTCDIHVCIQQLWAGADCNR